MALYYGSRIPMLTGRRMPSTGTWLPSSDTISLEIADEHLENCPQRVLKQQPNARKEPKHAIRGGFPTKRQPPKYLGVALDTRLNLTKHVENVSISVRERVGILHKLLSTNRGANFRSLRTIYVSYARHTCLNTQIQY
ncbi:hypothetical protein PoB_003964600 [Plakobranchus ocellatus]|uniref:Uncharacterized protein n=1 Tax=Plakobranchus ocellatus TaxID=259542 RepID=A0AAV4B2R9_9GAST|nr:hypothetical protein PoB_003964600 [Plakobranchus ocellatus]